MVFTFSTQEQIDNFQTNYPGCIQIEGDVVISGDDISNLNGLNVLTSIAGYLKIYGNSHLVDLTGLESLSFIGEGLIIGKNNVLTSFSGLENLATINNGGLYIGYFAVGGGNPSLSDISDLSNLSTIEGGLFINLNTVLQSLDPASTVYLQ